MHKPIRLHCDSNVNDQQLFAYFDIPISDVYLKTLKDSELYKTIHVSCHVSATTEKSLMYLGVSETATKHNILNIQITLFQAEESIFPITSTEDFELLLNLVLLHGGDTETAAQVFFEYWITLPGNIIRAGAYE